jgi:hypothetical protein
VIWQEAVMAVKKTFYFKLGDEVAIAESSERGVIIGRAHYLDQNPTYLLRYRAGDGRCVEQWWSESALVLVEGSV